MCKNDALRSAYDKSYGRSKYVSHYTKSDTACEILDGNSLKLSNPNMTNDTVEEKSGVHIIDLTEGDTAGCAKVVETINQHVRFLSLSMDEKITTPSPYTKDNDKYFTDKIYRSFANSRMWSDYGEEHKGVCFVFNEKKLRAHIEKSVKFKLVGAKQVTYKDRLQPFELSYDCIKDYCDGDSHINDIGALTSFNFYQNNKDYLNAKFYCKYSEWACENEFRYVTVTDASDPCYIHGIADCIEAIVVGEKMTKGKIRSLDVLIEDMVKKHQIKEAIPIRQITFEAGGKFLSEM